MERSWTELTRDEKRAQREQWFLEQAVSGAPSPEAAEAIRAHMQRLLDAYNVREPDMVPVNLPIGNQPAFAAGLTYRDLMYEPERAREAVQRFREDTGLPAPPPSAPPGEVLDFLDYRLYDWPGHGLDDSAPGYQFNEGEYMMADEYDHLIRDPSDFWARVYFPRVFGALEPLRLLSPMTDVTELPMIPGYFASFARPEVRAMLQRLIEVGEAMERYSERADVRLGSATLGASNVFSKAPFDILGDSLRGTRGVFLDMHRRPEQLLAAVDRLADVAIANAIELLDANRGLTAFFPLHKGADGWMSQQQFETFYWPPLRKVIHALIDEGIQVTLFAEGGFNSRLETVNEFPKGTVAWLFDQTDMVEAKRILGSNCCIMGNVPASLLTTGGPDEVKRHSRWLIEVCAPGGGYVLAPGCAGLDNVPVENLKAMQEAANEFGVYPRAEVTSQA
jgi:uroporphyrinogen-III decarboxylase